MSLDEIEERIAVIAESSRNSWALCGRWMARTFALLIAWAVTYVVAFVAAVASGQGWLVWLLMLPILVHGIVEPILIRQNAKEFGEVE